MNIRSVTAVGDHGNFILATDTEVWKYFAPGVDAMSRPWPARWEKVELPPSDPMPDSHADPVAVGEYDHFKTMPVALIAREIANRIPSSMSECRDYLFEFAAEIHFEQRCDRDRLINALFEIMRHYRRRHSSPAWWVGVEKILESVSGY